MLALNWSDVPALVILAWFGTMVVVIIVFNVRRLRARRVVRSISEDVKSKVLAAIDEAGRNSHGAVMLLRPVDGAAPGTSSFVGGAPILPHGVSVPDVVRGDEWAFLAQVHLLAPPLPQQWSDRLILLHASKDHGVVAVSLRVPPDVELAPARDSANARRCLHAIHLPGGSDRESRNDEDYTPPPYAASVLLDRVPRVRALLSGYSEQPERLLPHILVPGIATHEIETFLVSLMGGDPELIQGEHAVTCRHCRQGMRFLFHLGDVLGLSGDAPCVYVYGCDQHQDVVEAHVDVH